MAESQKNNYQQFEESMAKPQHTDSGTIRLLSHALGGATLLKQSIYLPKIHAIFDVPWIIALRIGRELPLYLLVIN